MKLVNKVAKYIIVAFMILYVLAGLSPGAFRSQASASPQAGDLPVQLPTDQLIIKFQETARMNLAGADQTEEMSRLSGVAGVELAYFHPMSGEAHVLKLPAALPEAEVAAMAARLSALPEVAYAEPDAIMQPLVTTPNDPQFPNQWHYKAPTAGTYGINAPAAWDVTTGSASVVVAVIDTGILNHADLSGRTVPGYDFIIDTFVSNDGDGRDPDPSDPGDWITTNECGFPHSAQNSSWHGTHVAGTIGAASNNSLGVAGINWNSKILPVRVLGKCGGYVSDIAEGMRWAAGLAVSGVPANANPAKVLNLSLGGSGACGSTYQDAINAIVAAGSTVVVAAGNDNANAINFRPANCNQVVTVASTDRDGDRAYYSNFGSVVEISAPGGETNSIPANGVLSTLNTGTTVPVADAYAYYQGTSMAAPHVAGVASLLYSRNPNLTPVQVTHILTTTVTAFPGGSTCNTSICGTGILNAANAVNGVSIEFVYLPLVVKPAPSAPPSAPTSLNATALSHNEIQLTWTDNANNETGFSIERSPDGSTSWGEIATVGANVSIYNNTGLTPNTTYYYRVRAYNGAGNSAYSNVDSAKTYQNLVNEGFESGAIPPPSWTRVSLNPNETWKLLSVSPHGGSFAAHVEYDPALSPQDEWLLSPVISLSEGTLSFWSFGSLYWCRDNFDNCDLNVWIVVGAPGGGDDIFVGKADDNWTGTFIWSQSMFNLTTLLPGGPVRIGFQYAGLDGAEIALDDILLYGP